MADGDQSTFEAVSPIFTVPDIAEALAFYTGMLEFEIAWTWGDPPTYASVCRDRVELNLGLPAAGEAARPSAAYIALTNIDVYYERILARGVRPSVEIGDRPYGMRDFAIVDPGGNNVSFGQPMAG
jgi:uncharacterized glyoxalase superfamily protein PhnB